MKTHRLSNHLRLLFGGAVLLPCVVLTVLAVRSIDREEAYIQRRIQDSLDVELTHVVGLLKDELRLVQEDLSAAAPPGEIGDPRSAFGEWKKKSGLVGVPFLLAPDYRILWPTREQYLTEADLSFLNWNREFVTDKTAIPFYQNAALLYKDQIVNPPAFSLRREKIDHQAARGEPEDKSSPSGELPAGKKAVEEKKSPLSEPRGAGPETARSASPVSVLDTKGAGGTRARAKIDDVRMEQQALAEFEMDDAARKRVYDAAAEKGQKTEQRTVSVAPGSAAAAAPAPPRAESLFISEPRKFSQITAGKDSGLVPRFIEEKLSLLFWKKTPGGRIVGCVLEQAEFQARMLKRLPDVYAPGRILTLLDENGRPQIVPTDDPGRDWRRPLAAREISEELPRWEAAAYATDPGAAAARARTTRLLLGGLIVLLFVSIAGGGTLVLNTLRSEMHIARQKTTFVTNVSHELKTPLTSIRMFAEMLKEGRQPDVEKQRKYLGLMVSETDRLTRLINNVLDFSRMEKGKKSYVTTKLEAVELVRELIESQRLRLEAEGFLVTFENSAGSAVIEADGEAFKQAVLNLLSNAEKYSPAVKSITVAVGKTDDSVLIGVLDQGLGIPAEETQKIFKEFYRVDQSLAAGVRGTGLGLTIAQKIVRDHGGDILYRPREGGGSIFEIIWPRIGES